MLKKFIISIAVMLFVLISYPSWAVTQDDISTVAANFLSYSGSDKAVESIIELEDMNVIFAYHVKLEGGGYLLIPATEDLPPIKGYSLKADFATLPDWYRDFLFLELKAYQNFGLRKRSAAKNSINSQYWEFLRKSNVKKGSRNYTPDTILMSTRWNQSFPYNKKFPYLNGGQTVAGCTQIATAQIMKYHAYPNRGKGTAVHNWNGQELKTILYKNYFWNRMPDELFLSTQEYIQDETALLIRDIGIVNEAGFSVGGTAASASIRGLMQYFGYANDILTMNNENENTFFTALKGEIDAERPVLLSLPGHMVVADGYASDPTGKKFHINMGWGGHDDDYYYLNQTIHTSSYTFPTTPPGLNIIYNIRPCTTGVNCYEELIALEGNDQQNGSKLTGKFDFETDTDRFPVYLKGNTRISGTRGYSSQAFYISVYDAHEGLVISQNNPLQKKLSAGRYFIDISLTNSSGNGGYSYDPSHINYTVDFVTDVLTQSEIQEVNSRDTIPVIQNDLKDMVISATSSGKKIRLDAVDADGDILGLNVTCSTDDLAVNIYQDVLTITPATQKGYGLITVTATAGGRSVQKSFTVLVNDEPVYLGRDFTINDIFENQNDFNKYLVYLDKNCTISGTRGYSSQAFYTCVMSDNNQYVVSMTDDTIRSNFTPGLYYIGASLDSGNYSYSYEPSMAGYVLTASCPTQVDIDTIADLLGINMHMNETGDILSDGDVNLKDVIFILQILTGIDLNGQSVDLEQCLDGTGPPSLRDAVSIMRKVANIR